MAELRRVVNLKRFLNIRKPAWAIALLLSMAWFWPQEPAEAINACLTVKSVQSCGDTSCTKSFTSLKILSQSLALPGDSGYTMGTPCGWKFCSTLVCSCGEPLGKNICDGEDPCL